MSQIHLYTTFYKEKKSARRQELLSCLEKNLSNATFTKVTVFNEGGDLSAFASEKLKFIDIEKRPLYQDFFQYINQHGSNNDIHIIANTDIYFDEHIAALQHLNLENTVLALSRWDTTESAKPRLYNKNSSQDVWIFKGSINSDLKADFPLGVPRCDNRLLYELQVAGYKVLNPAFSIKAFHLHKGQRALNYTESDNTYNIEPPYRYKYPHNFFGLFKTLLFNFQHKEKLGAYQYDIKKTNNWWLLKLLRKTYQIITKKEFPLIGYHNQ
jgi:hypothetical protein